MAERLGFIGLGIMGKPMARNLLEAGFAITVHSRGRGPVEELAAKHPSVGRTRNIGLFGIIELVKNRQTMEPLSPFNTLNETMQQLNRSLLDNGLSTFIRWWNVMTNPPLCINEAQLAEGFEIIDRSLGIADAAMEE